MNKGNALEKEDFQALVKLHETFPYFVIPKILAAGYGSENTGGASGDFLHWAAVQSPDRRRLKQLIEQGLDFLPPPVLEPAADEARVDTKSDIVPEEPSKEGIGDDSTTRTRAEILKIGRASCRERV